MSKLVLNGILFSFKFCMPNIQLLVFNLTASGQLKGIHSQINQLQWLPSQVHFIKSFGIC